MSLHATLGPSAAHRWIGCPGSQNLIRRLGVRSTSGPAAIRGNLLHDLGGGTILFVRGNGAKKEFPDEEAKGQVETYITHLFTPTHRDLVLCGCSPDTWEFHVEEKVGQCLPIHKDVWGTTDCVVRCPIHNWVRVVDLKTGHSEVAAEGNHQLAVYGLLALFDFAWPVEKVYLEIIQPPAPSGEVHKVWPMSPLALLECLPSYQAAAKATEDPNAPLIVGAHCKYCPAAALCPAREAEAHATAVLTFNRSGYDVRKLSRALEMVPQLEAWCEDVESFAYAEANHGVDIPRFKLAQKRDGNRKWIDESTAERVLLEYGGAGQHELLEPSKMRSPAQLEKIYPEDVINTLCKREPGGTVLVPNSDKRQAITVNRANVFQKHEVTETTEKRKELL